MSDYIPPRHCPVCLDPESLCCCSPLNQCDGCKRGLVRDGEIHRDNKGRAVMVCQEARYRSYATGDR